jgi:ABC-type phosphate transport system substrate-binding protein
MKSLSTRRIASACVVSAATVAALVLPGAASAVVGQQCSGVSITAQGSSLQAVAQQEIWAPKFHTSGDSFACDGTQGNKGTPTITYNSTGSGAALRSFGAEAKSPSEISFGPGNAFAATDEPPNEKQLEEIESNETPKTTNTLESIPVAQESVVILVHLPSGCTATSTAASGRLAFTNADLQGVFAGEIKEWGKITGGGDAVTGTGCSTDSITPIVRFDQSGTTHIFKRYLGLINSAPLATEDGSETWGELSEASLNTVWPTAAGVEKPAIKGGGEELAKVIATPGSIGYVNLAEARKSSSFVPPSGGANEPTFWAVLENSHKGSGKKEKVTYQDPSNNGEIATLDAANCGKTVYTNGKEPFPPSSVLATWNTVTTSVTLKEKTYSLCGLTYDLAFTHYDLLSGTTEPEATTVNNYLKFVTSKKQGQVLLPGDDYLGLPKDIITKAEAGAAAVGF